MHRKLKGHLDPLLTSLGCVGIPKVTIHHDPHEAHELTVGTLWKLALMAQLNWMTTWNGLAPKMEKENVTWRDMYIDFSNPNVDVTMLPSTIYLTGTNYRLATTHGNLKSSHWIRQSFLHGLYIETLETNQRYLRYCWITKMQCQGPRVTPYGFCKLGFRMETKTLEIIIHRFKYPYGCSSICQNTNNLPSRVAIKTWTVSNRGLTYASYLVVVSIRCSVCGTRASLTKRAHVKHSIGASTIGSINLLKKERL